MRLLVLAHVDGDEKARAAEQTVGQGMGGFGLAHPAGTGEQEHAHRRLRIGQPRPRVAHAACQQGQRLVLAQDALAQALFQRQQHLEFVLHHAPQRHAGPVRHHRRHRGGINLGMHQRLPALGLLERAAHAPRPFQRLLQRLALQSRQGLAVLLDRRHQDALLVPARLQRLQLVLCPGQIVLQFGAQRGIHRQAAQAVGLELLQTIGQMLDAGLQPLQPGRAGHLRHAHPGTGGIEQVDGLVRQLAAIDVARR